jgi:hypothetical protein
MEGKAEVGNFHLVQKNICRRLICDLQIVLKLVWTADLKEIQVYVVLK